MRPGRRGVLLIGLVMGLAAQLALPGCASEDSPEAPPPVVTGAPPPRSAMPGAAGSVPVGAADYPIPAGSIHVDAGAGQDTAAGTREAPLRTIQAACDRASPGQTIVIRGGLYHETVYVNQPVTIQNAPGEAVWLDGSQPVTEWTEDDALWSAPLPVLLDDSIGPDNGDPYVSDTHPSAAQPEMLFVGAHPLRQVPRRADVTPGAFFADRRSRRLYVADHPHDRTWRTATLAQAVVVSAPDVTIRGIGVRRYGNSVQTQGAVYLARRADLLENVVVEDVATTGISFYSDANQGTGQAVDVTVRRAGLMGIGGTNADHLVLRRVLIERANAERFNPTPNSAGIKITRSRNVLIESSVVTGSLRTTGIWLDESVVGFGVHHNRVIDNGVSGISAELSSKGRISGNLVDEHEFGIVVYSSGDIEIDNNVVHSNSAIDLDLRQDHRRQADPRAAGHDPRFAPGDDTNPWLVQNITVRCNVFGPGNARTRFRAVDQATDIPADQMNIRLHGNGFAPLPHAPVAQWGTGEGQQTRDVTDVTSLPGAPGEPRNVTGHSPSPQCGKIGPSLGR